MLRSAKRNTQAPLGQDDGGRENLNLFQLPLMEEILHHLDFQETCKYMYILGYSTYQLVQDFLHQQ